MNKTRFYNQNIDIELNQVKRFYEEKSKIPALNIAFLNNRLPQSAQDLRNEKEKQEMISFLGNKKYKILEIGCAQGRWVKNLAQKHIESYDGIDFCENSIQKAKEKFKNLPNLNFYQMEATNLDLNILKNDYNLVIICGISMYLNDSDILKLYKTLDSLIQSCAKIYLQESTSVINQRLTLKDFYSDELKTNYSAVYRKPEEYIDFVFKSFKNVKLLSQKYILTPKTGAREETNSCCFCFEKKTS